MQELLFVPGDGKTRTKHVDLGNGVKSQDEGVSGRTTKLVSLVSGQLQKRMLENQLNELMRKRDGGAKNMPNQVKRRRTLTVATNVDFEIPDFQDFSPHYSLSEKLGTPDWKGKAMRPSCYSSVIDSLFLPDASYHKNMLFSACCASVTAIAAISVSTESTSTGLSFLIGSYKAAENQDPKVRELREMEQKKTELWSELRELLHGTGSEQGLAEKASLSLIKESLKSNTVRDEKLACLSDALRSPCRLSRAKLAWGIISKPVYTFRLAASKRMQNVSAFTANWMPEWVYADKQIRQTERARVQCGYDVWPQKCNLEKCTYIHDKGHSAGEAAACRSVLQAVGVQKELDRDYDLKVQFEGLEKQYMELYNEVRNDDQNNLKMREMLAKIMRWAEENKLLGAGKPPLSKEVGNSNNSGVPSKREPDEAALLLDLVKLCDKEHLTLFEQECVKANEAPPGLEEAFTVAKLAVMVSRLPKLTTRNVMLHSFEPRLQETLPAFLDFEHAMQVFPGCLSIYVLYIEALSRNELKQPKEVVMTAILNVIAKGLSNAPSLGVESSQTTFSLILLGLFFRRCCGSQVMFLEGMLSGKIVNVEKVLAPRHFAAMPVLYAAVCGGVYPTSINKIWMLASGMPLSIDWEDIFVTRDERVINHFTRFLESHTFKDQNVRDSLIINYSQYLVAAGDVESATRYLTKSLKDNPNRLALFKELSDLFEGGQSPVIGFDSFELYERIIEKESTVVKDPQWHGIATLFYINLLLKHDKADKALEVASSGTFKEPFSTVMNGVVALLKGNEANFHAALKDLVSYEGVAAPALQEHILKEIIMYKIPSEEEVAKFAEISIDIPDLVIPGAQFAEWEAANLCVGLTENPYTVLKTTRPCRLLQAIEKGTQSEIAKEILFTDCAFIMTSNKSALETDSDSDGEAELIDIDDAMRR